MNKHLHVAIIGGGFTGLSAAYYISQAGHTVTILERGQELGGLASGFTIQGTSLERAYHHLFKTDTDILRFLDELGIGHKLVWNKSSMALYFGDTLYPFSTPFDLLRFKPLSFISRVRAGLVVLYLQKTKNWRKFIPVPARAWMKRWAGQEVMHVIWEPLLFGKFNTYFDRISMAWLWGRVHIRANSREKGGAKEMLGYIDGGFAVIVEEITRQLREHGVAIHTGVKVEEITSSDAGPRVRYIREGVEVEEAFDHVIATTPSPVFGTLVEKSVSKEYLEKLNSIDHLGAVCLVFSSEQSLSPYYWHNINNTGFPFLVFIQHTRLIDASKYGGKEVYYIGSYVPPTHAYFTMSDEEIKSLWFSYLKKIFPAFDEAHLVDVHLFKFKHAQCIVDVEYEQKIPPYQTPLREVYLANFSQIFPEDRGTNYAVREGKRVANLILQNER